MKTNELLEEWCIEQGFIPWHPPGSVCHFAVFKVRFYDSQAICWSCDRERFDKQHKSKREFSLLENASDFIFCYNGLKDPHSLTNLKEFIIKHWNHRH